MAVHSAFGGEIDLHGGGVDLQFPHHENEIAQSQAASGSAAVWCPFFMHTGHLTLSTTKMSKSLGNCISVEVRDDASRAPAFGNVGILMAGVVGVFARMDGG